jgi:hypothetical protein
MMIMSENRNIARLAPIVVLGLGFAVYLSTIVGCARVPQEPEERVRHFGPDRQVSMVVYFKSDTDVDAMNAFSENTLRPGENKLALVFDTSKPGHRGLPLHSPPKRRPSNEIRSETR